MLQGVDACEYRVDDLDGRHLFLRDRAGQIGRGHPAEVAVVHGGGYCMLPGPCPRRLSESSITSIDRTSRSARSTSSRFMYGNLSYEQAARSLALWSSEVMPKFSKADGTEKSR
jgi:hypothetical protein